LARVESVTGNWWRYENPWNDSHVESSTSTWALRSSVLNTVATRSRSRGRPSNTTIRDCFRFSRRSSCIAWHCARTWCSSFPPVTHASSSHTSAVSYSAGA